MSSTMSVQNPYLRVQVADINCGVLISVVSMLAYEVGTYTRRYPATSSA